VSFHGGTDRTIHELQTLIRTHRKWPTEPVFVNFDCEGVPGSDLRKALNQLARKDDFLKVTALESGRGGAADAHMLKRAGVYNRRSLYWWVACQRFKTCAGLVHDDDLREELLFFYFLPDQTHGSRLPEKKQFRRQYGRSTDKGDAVAYCMWDGELPPTSELEAEAQAEAAQPPPPPARPAPRTELEAVAQMQRNPRTGETMLNNRMISGPSPASRPSPHRRGR